MIRSARVGKWREMVPTRTPARAAMSRTGASTPEVTNTAAAASSRVCSLRRASARFRGNVSVTGSLSPLIDKRNIAAYVERSSVPLVMMPEPARQEQPTMAPTTTQPSFGLATAPQQVSYHDVLRVWREADAIPELERAWRFDHLLRLGGR